MCRKSTSSSTCEQVGLATVVTALCIKRLVETRAIDSVVSCDFMIVN